MRRTGASTGLADSLPPDIADLVFRRIVVLCLLTAGLAALGSDQACGNNCNNVFNEMK